ncbi:MAG: YdcF family protein [Methylococcaceae bacterium]
MLWGLNRRRWAAGLLSGALGWLLLWSLPPVSTALRDSLESHYVNQVVENLPAADVIVVFGGVMDSSGPGHPYPDMGAAADRVWHAARLYHAGKSSRVILSGGRFDWMTEGATEAESMQNLLLDLGVPNSAIVLENRSLSTRENALNCAKLMRDLGLERALLVTSSLHMRRAEAALRMAGATTIAAPTDFGVSAIQNPLMNWLPNVSALSGSTSALHEIIGWWVYRWRGWVA